MTIAYSQTDADLVPLLVAGEIGAIESLYDRYSRLALGLAYKILQDRTAAEDVVQEAFVAVWRRARTYDAGRGHLRVWFLSIVRNRAIDRLRSTAARREIGCSVEDAGLSIQDAAWDHIEAQSNRAQVRQLLDDLPDGQRRAIELSYFGGLTHPQVAAIMGLPLGTAKGRQRLGLQKMRLALQPVELS
jgi:RNA polymerase sigma-70 factor (ECF subfamily)